METLKPIEHWFKHQVVRVSTRLLKKGMTEFRPLDGREMNHVLLIRPEKLGDTVISFPVIDGLMQHFPHLKISLLTSPTSLPIVKADPRFEKIFLYQKKPLRDFRQLFAMRREKFDCIIDLICDDSVTALYLSQLCAPGKPRIGVGKSRYADFYDFNYTYRDGEAGHVIDNTLKLLGAFNIDSDSVSGFAPPFINPVFKKQAAELMSQVWNGRAESGVIGYNLSAGKPNRFWPLEKAKEMLGRVLAHDDSCNIMLLCMPAQRHDASWLCDKLGDRVHVIPDGWNILQASALIKELDLLISPDTSLVHIARSFRVPVVGMYPQFMRNFILWRPYSQEGGVVVSKRDEIDSIAVDDLFDAYTKLYDVRQKVTN